MTVGLQLTEDTALSKITIENISMKLGLKLPAMLFVDAKCNSMFRAAIQEL